MLARMTTAFLCCFFVSACLSGCGGGSRLPDGVDVGSVTGTLTFNGGAVPEGCTVSFMPEGGTGLPGVSNVTGDGTFKLRLRGSFDIPTGIYKVVVTPPAGPEMTPEQAMEASVAGKLDTGDVKEVPQKYRSTETTPEAHEVKPGENNFTIDMKP